MRAIRTGYTSVMIDASAMPLEENIALTRRIVEVAHAVNVSVEAETWHDWRRLGSSEGGHNEILFTDPAQAERFVNETGVDTLAVAIGTSHGLYPAGMQPKLDIERLPGNSSTHQYPPCFARWFRNKDSSVAESIQYCSIGKINISSDRKKPLSRWKKNSSPAAMNQTRCISNRWRRLVQW